MSASKWLVPLNVHQSLSLRTVAKNSRQLQNISSSIHDLSISLQSLENSAFKIAGNTKNILALLESKEHKDTTIAAMRKLIFRHYQTCSEAIKEEDKLTAISSCIISESLLYQDWFNIDLFSHVSFEEMAKVDEMLRNSSDIIENIRTELSEDEYLMVGELPFFLKRIKVFEIKSNDLLDRLKTFFSHLYSINIVYTGERAKSILGETPMNEYQILQFKLDYSDAKFDWERKKNTAESLKVRELSPYWKNIINNPPQKGNYPRKEGWTLGSTSIIEHSVKRVGLEKTIEKITINEEAIHEVKMSRSKLGFWADSTLKENYDKKIIEIDKLQHGLRQIKSDIIRHSTEIRVISEDFEKTFKGRLFLDNL